MIKQFKMSVKLVRYAFGIKQGIGFGILFTIIGVLCSVLPSEIGAIGEFFLMMIGLWVTQVFYSLGVSNLIQTSKWKKAVETSMPAILSLAGYIIAYIVCFLLKIPRLLEGEEQELMNISAELIAAGFIAFFIMAYSGIAYKLFVVGTILFAGSFIGMGTISGIARVFGWTLSIPSVGAAVLIGFAEIVAGALVQYGLSCLLYKYPLSKHAQLRGLAKIM